MSTLIAALETLAGKFQSLFSILFISIVVWVIAVTWNSLTRNVEGLKKDVQEMKTDIVETKMDIAEIEAILLRKTP